MRSYRRFFAAVDHVESKFEAIRGAELVEDSKKIIAYGVFAEIELPGNVLVSEAFGDEISQFCFAFREQIRGIAGAWSRVCGGAGSIGERIESDAQLRAIGPDLTFTNDMDALAQDLKRLIAGEHADSAGANA